MARTSFIHLFRGVDITRSPNPDVAGYPQIFCDNISWDILGHLWGQKPFEDVLEDVLEDVFGLPPPPGPTLVAAMGHVPWAIPQAARKGADMTMDMGICKIT